MFYNQRVCVTPFVDRLLLPLLLICCIALEESQSLIIYLNRLLEVYTLSPLFLLWENNIY